MIHAYAQLFWLRDTDDTELAELTNLMASVVSESKSNPDVIVDSLLAACTGVAGSLEVLKI
jgi:t-SNARE complex subunit (syntaxin)